MTSLILTSPATMLAPLPTTPNMRTLDPALTYLLSGEMAAFGRANGDRVDAIVAGGNGTLLQRSFDQVQASYSGPKLKTGATPNGKPSLLFEGTEAISNSHGITTGPVYYAMVFKIVGPQNAFARLLSMTAHAWTPNTAGDNISVNFGNSFTGQIVNGNWYVLVAGHDEDGIGHIAMTGRSPVQGRMMGTGVSALDRLGTSNNTSGNVGIKGEVAEIRRVAEAMTFAKVIALKDEISTYYGIAD